MASNQEQKIGDFKVDKTGGVQMHGILLKKPVGHKSTTWQKRFFVLKESFLMYYPEAEKKAFADKGIFNIHPKGIIPVGYCNVEETVFPGISYGVSITLPDNTSAICLGAESYDTRTAWITALEKASTVTFENCSIGEAMIKSLQEQGLQLAKEKQEIYEKFRKEEKDAGSEREQREMLEEYNQQLIEEKLSIEYLVEELQNTQQTIRRELDEAIQTYQALEMQREEMLTANEVLHTSLLELSVEKESITERLKSSEAIGEEAALLRHQLDDLSQSTEQLKAEKHQVENKLQKNEEEMKEYSKERKEFCADVDRLKDDIQELNQEKETVEVKLKEEILERRNLQNKFIECQEALQRLEHELIISRSRASSRDDEDDRANQLADDVKNLKLFFETLSAKNSSENGISAKNRRYSRRYTQIKKLRHVRGNNVPIPAPRISHEKLSSTPGIISQLEEESE